MRPILITLLVAWTYGDLSGAGPRAVAATPAVAPAEPKPDPPVPDPAVPEPRQAIREESFPRRTLPPDWTPAEAPRPVPVHAAKPVRYWVKDSAHPGWWGHGRIVGGWLVDVDEWRADPIPIHRGPP